MLNAEERYRLLEEASELSERWDFESVLRLLEGIALDDLKAEPELGCLLARAFYHSSEEDRAYELAEALAASCAVRGRDRVYCRRLLIMANVRVAKGDLAAGTTAYLELLSLASDAKDQRLVAAATMNLATIAWLRCEYATALSSFARAIVAFEMLHDTYRLAGCHHNLAMVYKELGLLRESSQHFDFSRAMFIDCGAEKELIFNDFERALLMHVRGESSAAQVVATNAYRKAALLNLPYEQGESLRVLGIIRRDRQQYSQALHDFESALVLAERTEAKLLHAEVLEECAVLYGEVGEEQSAHRCGQIASRFYTDMGSYTRAARAESRIRDALSRAATHS